MHDPNFPRGLDIKPLQIPTDQRELEGQTAAIAQYGIAGRVWEAGAALIDYFDPSKSCDPPCSLLRPSEPSAPYSIIELGSGQSVPSLHLAARLSAHDSLVLTDLPNVISLCEERKDDWVKEHKDGPRLSVAPLAWGEGIASVHARMPFSHILMCDLIYFPNLYPALLRTLLELSEPDQLPTEDTFGPEIILSYFSRTLALEQSFFDAFSLYFQMTPVVNPTWEARVYICKRWRITEEWRMPEMHEVMNGVKGVVQGRSFGLIDELFGALEWDA